MKFLVTVRTQDGKPAQTQWAGFPLQSTCNVHKVWVEADSEASAVDSLFEATALIRDGDFRVVILNVIEESHIPVEW